MPVDEVGQIAHWIQEATAERGNAVYLADARSPRLVRYRDLAEPSWLVHQLAGVRTPS